MRVISGKYRGMLLATPEGITTRPTTDRIKETLFNMIAFDVGESNFLDLFAGSGQMGIEAVSRGASSVVFVDNDKRAIECIESNIAKAKALDNTTLIKADVFTALNQLDNKAVFDLVFMDPPYNQLLEKRVLEQISNKSYINCDTIIIVEASLETDFSYVSELGYILTKEKLYKTNKHIFLKKAL